MHAPERFAAAVYSYQLIRKRGPGDSVGRKTIPTFAQVYLCFTSGCYIQEVDYLICLRLLQTGFVYLNDSCMLQS